VNATLIGHWFTTSLHILRKIFIFAISLRLPRFWFTLYFPVIRQHRHRKSEQLFKKEFY